MLEGLDATTEPDVARPLAAIHLANGQTALARDVLERALEQVDPLSTAAAPLLALLVDVHLGANRIDDANAAADKLADVRGLHAGHYLAAVAALRSGRICLASGTGDSAGLSSRGAGSSSPKRRCRWRLRTRDWQSPTRC